MTPQDVMKIVQENEVKFVDFRFTDTKGKEHHVGVPVSAFDEDKFESGHAFDGSSIAGWKGIQASDMLLMPDPTPPTSTRSSTRPPWSCPAT
jgi:glutamine synthetase